MTSASNQLLVASHRLLLLSRFPSPLTFHRRQELPFHHKMAYFNRGSSSDDLSLEISVTENSNRIRLVQQQVALGQFDLQSFIHEETLKDTAVVEAFEAIETRMENIEMAIGHIMQAQSPGSGSPTGLKRFFHWAWALLRRGMSLGGWV